MALNTVGDIKTVQGTGANSEPLAHIRPGTVTVRARSPIQKDDFDMAIWEPFDTARSVRYRVNLASHKPFLARVLTHTGSRLYEQGERVQADCPRVEARIVE